VESNGGSLENVAKVFVLFLLMTLEACWKIFLGGNCQKSPKMGNILQSHKWPDLFNLVNCELLMIWHIVRVRHMTHFVLKNSSFYTSMQYADTCIAEIPVRWPKMPLKTTKVFCLAGHHAIGASC
jgi:hypothetical protein